MKITPALERMLLKAIDQGRLHVVGGFVEGASDVDPIADPTFDTKAQVEKALRTGLLRFGDAWNTYHATEAGRAAIAALDEARQVKAAKKKASAAMRAERQVQAAE